MRNAILRAPKATVNPQTGKPFTPKYILQVFRSLCYDDDPADPWGHQLPYQKAALPDELMQHRVAWAEKIQESSHTPAWYARNCIWLDPVQHHHPRKSSDRLPPTEEQEGQGQTLAPRSLEAVFEEQPRCPACQDAAAVG